MKNILYIETFPGINTVGGSTISLLHLVKNLNKSVYNPIVLFYYPNKFIYKFLDANINVHCLEKKYSSTIIKRKFVSQENNPNQNVKQSTSSMVYKIKNIWRNAPHIINIFLINKLIKENNVHLVHLNNGVRSNLDGLYAAMLQGIPAVCHDREVPEPLSFHHKIIVHKLQRIICISNALKSNYKKHGISEDKLSVVYNCVNLHDAIPTMSSDEIRNDLGIKNNAFVIGVIATIAPWKGQEVVIRSMRKLKDTINDVHCVFVGDYITTRGMLYKKKLERMTENFDLVNQVSFVGFKEDVYNYINASDVIVHSSIKPEPFGRILIESMALKKPVIASNAGGVPEIVENEHTGLLYEPGSSEQLIRSIKYIYNNKSLMEKFGKNGYESVCRRFTVANHIRNIYDIYNSILN